MRGTFRNVDENARSASDCVTNQVGPEEAGSEAHGTEESLAKCINPLGLVELAELNAIRKHQCHGGQGGYSQAWEYESKTQIQHERPQCVTPVLYKKRGPRRCQL
jgi:hypothetical protein